MSLNLNFSSFHDLIASSKFFLITTSSILLKTYLKSPSSVIPYMLAFPTAIFLILFHLVTSFNSVNLLLSINTVPLSVKPTIL